MKKIMFNDKYGLTAAVLNGLKTMTRILVKPSCIDDAFMELIDKVSGKGTWNSNPWVFAYSFELV